MPAPSVPRSEMVGAFLWLRDYAARIIYSESTALPYKKMADKTQHLQELRQALAQLLCEHFVQEDLTRTLHRHFKGALTALDKHLSQTASRVDKQDSR